MKKENKVVILENASEKALYIGGLMLAMQNVNSCWEWGVYDYAVIILDNLNHYPLKLDEKTLLNGATNWQEYSEGGCALIYDTDIAKTLCTESELKRTHNGLKYPNKNETWIDVQTRALKQAYRKIQNFNSTLREF